MAVDKVVVSIKMIGSISILNQHIVAIRESRWTHRGIGQKVVLIGNSARIP
jgi:hypothetical protein